MSKTERDLRRVGIAGAGEVFARGLEEEMRLHKDEGAGKLIAERLDASERGTCESAIGMTMNLREAWQPTWAGNGSNISAGP